MATRPFKFSEGEYYHVYNRGIEKRKIFNGVEDKIRFQKLLYLCNGTLDLDLRRLPPGPAYLVDVGARLVDIGAYALMDNHFHLLLKEIKPGGISNFMLKLGTSHSMYCNLRLGRSGRLFESTYKARHVKSDNHLRRLFSYIHLNPVALMENTDMASSLVTINKLREYPFSSYQDHCAKKRLERKILKLSSFPRYFSQVSEYVDDMKDWLKLSAG